MKELPRKIHKAIVCYGLLAWPVLACNGYWLGHPSSLWYELFNNLGFLWILSAIYFFLAIVLNRGFRESLLARLAGFKERDEREQSVTGHAARNSFLIVLATLVLCLAMSLTRVRLVMNEKPNATGHKGLLEVGIGFSSKQLNIYSLPALSHDPAARYELHGTILPSNMALIFALLILIQLAAFKLASRRHYAGLQE